MKLKLKRNVIDACGVDSGQLMWLRSDLATQHYRHDGDLSLEWPTLVMKDGRRFRAGGKDFFRWDDVLPAIGKSPNDALEAGEAVTLEPRGQLMGALDYAGACAASSWVSGFGYIGRDGMENGLVFHVRHDGLYQMREAVEIDGAGKLGRTFGLVSFPDFNASAGVTVWMVPIGRIRTMGSLCMVDPCHGAAAASFHRVQMDADGDTVIYGRYQDGAHGLTAIAVELV